MIHVHHRVYLSTVRFLRSVESTVTPNQIRTRDLVASLPQFRALDYIGDCYLERDVADLDTEHESAVTDQVRFQLGDGAIAALAPGLQGNPESVLRSLTIILHEYGALSVFVEFQVAHGAFEKLYSNAVCVAVDQVFPLVYSLLEVLTKWDWIAPSPTHFGLPRHLVEGIPGPLESSPWHPVLDIKIDRRDFRPVDEYRYYDHFVLSQGSEWDGVGVLERHFGKCSFESDVLDDPIASVRYFSDPSTIVWKLKASSPTLSTILPQLRPITVDLLEHKVSNTGYRTCLSTQDAVLSGQRIPQSTIARMLLNYELVLARVGLVKRRFSPNEWALLNRFHVADSGMQSELELYPRSVAVLNRILDNPAVHQKDVFISYWSGHKERATSLADALTRRGVRVFQDRLFETGIEFGEKWEISLLDEISKCEEMCVIVGKDTFSVSNWVVLEIGAAAVLKKRITPILYDGLNVTDLPSFLSGFQSVLSENAAHYVDQVRKRCLGFRVGLD